MTRPLRDALAARLTPEELAEYDATLARIQERQSSPAARWEMLQDLYAPPDEEGVRRPENGFISAEQVLELLDMPVTPPRPAPRPRRS